MLTKPLSNEGDEALREIINIPNRYIGRSFMDELDECAEREKLHLYEALKRMFIILCLTRVNRSEYGRSQSYHAPCAGVVQIIVRLDELPGGGFPPTRMHGTFCASGMRQR